MNSQFSLPRFVSVWFALVFNASAAPQPVALSAEQRAFFESKVRPVLKENCYKCHSVEAGKAKGELTLDTRDGWQKGGKNGAAIVPGDPQKSLLVQAIGYHDPDLQMPPKGEKLSTDEVAALTEWVQMGAPDPREAGAAKLSGLTDKARSHWAYQPVQKPAVPVTKNAQWSRTPVDAFILQKLDAAHMAPAPDADKETLLRRATYDLIGLPPTPAEVEAFLADNSANAFEKVVDRLLAAPQYGERWGRYWLDTARYSDTVGGDRKLLRRGIDYRYPYAWTYRDYVIGAFNDDKPYDRFILEQLAADQLPDRAGDSTLAALGFLTVGERFQNPNDVINDRIDVVSKGFLAMTVTCARCHDHMFDPIPTKDYYALHGIFASTLEPSEKPLIGAAPEEAQLSDFQTKLAALELENRAVYYRQIEKLNGEVQKKVAALLLVSQFAGGKKGGSAEDLQQRNKLLQRANIDRNLLQAVQKNAGRRSAIFAPFREFAQLRTSEFAEKAPALAAKIAEGNGRGRAMNSLVVAAFKDAVPASLEDVAQIYAKLFADLAPQRKAYVAACASALSGPVTGFDADLVELLSYPFQSLPAAQLDTAEIRKFVASLPPQISVRAGFTLARINELELTHPSAPARAMLVADAARPKNSSVFIRGQAETRGDIVPRGFLAVLSPGGKSIAFHEGSGRLELAQAIASKSNPLTARVMVNRVWMHHFGEGFVPTADDLGTQSEAPSHPELLDYLASYFMEQNWSLKKLHKLIMLSRVYQESSRTNDDYATRDPQNRLLWRGNIRRLDFEATRDSLLAFSGNLDATIGGKPINLTEEPYSFRRSVYGYIDRGNLPELMSQFDFSDPDMPNSKRSSTVVPQQALFLMNSAMAIDVTRKIFERPELVGADDNLARVIALYRVIFQRTPKPQEIQLALNFVGQELVKTPEMPEPNARPEAPMMKGRAARQAARMQANKGRYVGTAAIKNSGERVDRKPLTAWETYAQALLLSNEAAYVN